MVKTVKMSSLMQEAASSLLEFAILWDLIDEHGKLTCDVSVYNNCLRTTFDEIVFLKYKDCLIVRDFLWRHYFNRDFKTKSAMSIIRATFKKQKNFVDFCEPNLPDEIHTLEGMNGEFVEKAQKAFDYIMKTFPVE